MGSNGRKRQPGIKWQKKGRKNFRALCAMVLEVAEQAKVIFSTLVSYESQKLPVDQSES